MTTFLLGADPEFFVRKGGKPFSAHGLIEGTKSSPVKTEVGAAQVDGMALEFNIDPVRSDDFERFNFEIVKTLDDIRKMAKERDPSLTFAYEPIMEFDEAFFDAQPDAAKELGCDPDFNAYTLKMNPRPDGDRLFRTGAGHVHIGWGADIPVDNEEHMEICASFIKMLDATVGMYMTYIDRDPRRRELYGAAGAFRPKPYGVEYRTPSNVWIKNRDRRKVMHFLINQALQYMQAGHNVSAVTGITEETVRNIINTGDFNAAQYHVDRYMRYGDAQAAWNKIKRDMVEAVAKAA